MKDFGKGTALITGASAGIGAALAREFAKNGHDVILVARSIGKLKKLSAELAKKYDVRAIALPSDLGVSGAAEALYSQISKRRSQVDYLVNNAGLLHEGSFWETPLAAHQQLLQLNIGALTALTHLFLPAMIERKRGRILNLASTSAFQPIPYLSTYAASKAFVLSFSEALNIELKGKGVKITALCPGFTETEMISKASGKSMSVPFVRNLTVEEVAREGYAACVAGKPLYINGASNRAMIALSSLQPRWSQRLITEIIAKKGIT
ncbi:MAG: SDR family oxidoreductase [Pseudomonadota bacterium]|nr:SDR family oxidoreductase [Pseudomonadota bacterium]